ncbi:portal protein [Rhodomicrobium udaipurense JA643]|uniref:Phage portal protein n=1 Tax=Rhodomicrobium udaipurense TaxID=1202716 RepID=A0A8I1GEE6_9HYPH|nr:phage portal protein [Rhodomicrobium udaipurense]KAI93924.1 portal protein [Rhodomicrobium udaipurense JA643]MBJ7543254.1 phage portal protein [Rhodomicrobium udaipurense]
MAWVDRVIGVFSPMAEARRLQARAAVSVLRNAAASRSYDGAQASRRGSWGGRQSANAAIGPNLPSLRDRARDLVRNTPMARVPDVLAAHIVGTGIVPTSRTGNRALDKRVNALFEAWQKQSIVSGEVDFYGAQAVLVRSMVEGGDALVRYLPRRADSGLPVPLQLRLMEGDQLDERKHGLLGRSAETTTVLGIEFTEDGARNGYWIRKAHPGDLCTRGNENTSVFVQARDIAHIYRPLRIGQARGVTWFAPVMLTARDLADYMEATLVKARVESCFAGFVTSADTSMPNTLGGQVKQASEPRRGPDTLELSPGMITRLEPGETMAFAQPSSSNSFEAFTLNAAMNIAAGTGITYDQFTGDLRQANYSSLRAGKIEFRALVRQLQYHLMIPKLCQPTWDRFIECAILSGALRLRKDGYPVKWIAPGFEPIDPLKDLKADVLAVRTGRMSWEEFVAEWGNDPETQLDELARINAAFDERGLILDIDPRKVAASGAAQAQPSRPSEE